MPGFNTAVQVLSGGLRIEYIAKAAHIENLGKYPEVT
jgi:hypothetical protein